MSTLTDRVRTARRSLQAEVGTAREVLSRGRHLQAEITTLRARKQIEDESVAVLTRFGEAQQAALHARIEALVTQGLQTIFAEQMTFHLVQTTRANRAEVDFVIRSTLADGTTLETGVTDACGGGLAAIVGFLLRVIILILDAGRHGETVIFLDETFGHVSADYEPRLAEFIRELVDKTGIQIIMVTHSEAFNEAADTRYRFTRGSDGATKAKAF